eukprot:UN05626
MSQVALIANNNIPQPPTQPKVPKKPKVPKVPKKQCAICQKLYAKTYLRKHMLTHESAINEWKICGLNGCTEKFESDAAIVRHQKQASQHVVQRTQISSLCPRCQISHLSKSLALRQVFCSNRLCGYQTKYIGGSAVDTYSARTSSNLS